MRFSGFIMLSTGAAFQKKMLTKIASDEQEWYLPQHLKSDCFESRPVSSTKKSPPHLFDGKKKMLRAPQPSGSELVKAQVALLDANGTQNPGAGIGELVPFVVVLKDGFSMQRCFKDEMYYHGDKFHDNKHDYEIGDRSNVSIVHYTDHVPKEDRKSMTPEECFRFCRTVPDMFNFGILNGRECYCAPWSKRMAGDSSSCDAPCPGSPTQMCGGRSKSSVFEMHMCANTEEELTDAEEATEAALHELSEATTQLRDAANQGQKESEELQMMLGIMGDHAASNNFQAAKVEAGLILRLVKESDALTEELEGLQEGVDALLHPPSPSLVQAGRGVARGRSGGPDFATVEVVEKAEKLTSGMKTAIKASKDLIERMHQKFEIQRFMMTEKGGEATRDRNKQYYDAYYFVHQDSPMGDAWVKDKSTCSGDLVSEPLFAMTLDECAYACDQAAGKGCTSFSWISKGSGMCFLFSQVEKVTQYDMCAKALEGECAPSPANKTANEPALTQVRSGSTATPFPFKVKSLEPNATLFKESVQGMCTAVYGCPGALPEEVVTDCSLMETYSCRGDTIRSPKIEDKDGGISMSFRGSVPSGTRASSCAVNTEYCSGCKKYSTCAGPYLETEQIEIKKGDVASYTWASSGAVDSYEVFVGLYSETCGLVDYQFQRGAKQEWQTFELFAPKTDKYYMKFMLGSYDGTGGGAVGADMQVKDVKQTKASVPRDLGVEAKCMVKLSEFSGLSLKPDKSGQCKHCIKDATKRCLKPDGSFPTPKAYDEKFGDHKDGEEDE